MEAAPIQEVSGQQRSPLGDKIVLADRFELEAILGQGSFGITYLARDRVLRDRCIIKELAPVGVARQANGWIEFPSMDPGSLHRLRHTFCDHPAQASRKATQGVLPVRLGFQEFGTALYATEFLGSTRTLAAVRDPDPHWTKEVFIKALDILRQIHDAGMRHQDLRPSNFLLWGRSNLSLIDFGGAREWFWDLEGGSDSLFAPYEQCVSSMFRGPASDLYSLAASFFFALTGQLPPSVESRLKGEDLADITHGRKDLDERLIHALNACLKLDYDDRPSDVAEVRQMLTEGSKVYVSGGQLQELDQRMVQLQSFRYLIRECPSCRDVLDRPQPLKLGLCPVCREGKIEKIPLEDKACPVCRSGVLQERPTDADPLICPFCSSVLKTSGILHKKALCPQCHEVWNKTNSCWTRIQTGETKTWGEWYAGSGRPNSVLLCDTCAAQYDVLLDQRRKQVWPTAQGPKRRTKEEWARIALGLPPGSGNASCSKCSAEYHLDGDKVTLLRIRHDPYSLMAPYAGRLLSLDQARWVAFGKTSFHVGLLCNACQTEFDEQPGSLKLVRSRHERLRRLLGECHSLADWHRIAQELPEVGNERDLEESLRESVRESYGHGTLPFDSRNLDLIWLGTASRPGKAAKLKLEISSEAISYGRRLRYRRIPLADIADPHAEGNMLGFLTASMGIQQFEVKPVEFLVRLKSGSVKLQLDATDLASRLKTTIAKLPTSSDVARA